MHDINSIHDVHNEIKKKPISFIIGFLVIFGIVFVLIFQQRSSQIANNNSAPSRQQQRLTQAVTEKVTHPVKLALLYQNPKSINTNLDLTPEEVAKTYNVAILPKDIAQTQFPLYEKAGYKGTSLQYMLLMGLGGPAGLISQTPCTPEQKQYAPWTDTVTMDPGAFCQIHDSIISDQSKFDHDLNSKTPAIRATEDWFLHRKDYQGNKGERFMVDIGMLGGVVYIPNPNNKQFQEFYIARLKKTLQSFESDGIFFEDIDLSWTQLTNLGSEPAEFSSSNAYADAVFNLVKNVYGSLNENNNRAEVWGNFVGGQNDGKEWDRFMPYLDGAMMPDFVLSNGFGSQAPQILENQLLQADKWIGSGHQLIAVAQGNQQYNQPLARYSMAGYLLVTDGVNASYHYTSTPGNYGYLWDYPEYNYQLGKPVAARKKVSSDPVLRFTRDFECGIVEMQFDKTTSIPFGQITYKEGCIPGVPTPTVTLTPTLTPVPPTATLIPSWTPIPTWTPAPTWTLVPTVTPLPTFTPTPTPLSCGWCGSSCVSYDPTRNCPMNLPQSGFDCRAVQINGSFQCQKVAQ